MKTMIRMAMVVALVGVAGLAGCAPDQVPSIVTEPRRPAVVDPPGLYEGPGNTSRAVGVLDLIELEGGFWAVTGVASTDAAESTIVAVIANAGPVESQLVQVRGRYVEVIGVLTDDASIRMAGPEIIADEIRVLEGVLPEDGL